MDKVKATPHEIVYINAGEIYKNPTSSELGGNYTHDPAADPIFQLQKNDGKKYFFTPEFKAFFPPSDVAGVSLDKYNLCPDITLWVSLGAKVEDEELNYDLFFAVDSSAQLQKVAEYYSLPYPSTPEVDAIIDTNLAMLSFWNVGGRPVVPAGIKYVDGVPTLLKLYTYPKPHGEWDVWMYGASYYDSGKCYEQGSVDFKYTGGEVVEGAHMRESMSFTKAEQILSERQDGTITKYSFTSNKDTMSDPGMFWQGTESDINGNVIRTKQYQSSDFVQRMIGRKTGGPTFSEVDRCPDITLWLGRSWYDGVDEQEMLFPVTSGSATLDAVAAYYNLPIPYNAEQKTILDTAPELYRARHYDLNKAGPGNYVPVVVGSVTFSEGEPVRLLLYTFMRQWEFENQIVLPEFE